MLNDFNEPSYEPASTGQRFVNYLIDVIIFYVVIIVFSFIFGLAFASSIESESDLETGSSILIIYLVVFAVFFAYYTFLEGSKGKTIGKMVSKTRVVCEDGSPMTYGKAFLRTLCRMVPFEFISAFTGTQMWHDSWTKTKVVKDQ